VVESKTRNAKVLDIVPHAELTRFIFSCKKNEIFYPSEPKLLNIVGKKASNPEQKKLMKMDSSGVNHAASIYYQIDSKKEAVEKASLRLSAKFVPSNMRTNTDLKPSSELTLLNTIECLKSRIIVAQFVETNLNPEGWQSIIATKQESYGAYCVLIAITNC
jgi:hypothetical protein